MTDKEIIKALDYCKDCYANINIDIIDLINRKQAEIEKLTTENQLLGMAANSYKSHYNEAKVEAVKEFISSATDLCYKEFENNLEVAHTFASILTKSQKEMVGD